MNMTSSFWLWEEREDSETQICSVQGKCLSDLVVGLSVRVRTINVFSSPRWCNRSPGRLVDGSRTQETLRRPWVASGSPWWRRRRRITCSGRLEPPPELWKRWKDGRQQMWNYTNIYINVYFNSITRQCTNWKIWNNWRSASCSSSALSSFPLLFGLLCLFSGGSKSKNINI